MTITGLPVEAIEARRARHLRNISELDYRRNVVKLATVGGLRQKQIAVLVNVSQPNVQKVLRRASGIAMPREGFSGADPFEICERYAAGLIGRAQLVDELTRWEYAQAGQTADPVDDLVVDVPGSVDDLDRALRRGLIDDALYDEIADRLEARAHAS